MVHVLGPHEVFVSPSHTESSYSHSHSIPQPISLQFHYCLCTLLICCSTWRMVCLFFFSGAIYMPFPYRVTLFSFPLHSFNCCSHSPIRQFSLLTLRSFPVLCHVLFLFSFDAVPMPFNVQSCELLWSVGLILLPDGPPCCPQNLFISFPIKGSPVPIPIPFPDRKSVV